MSKDLAIQAIREKLEAIARRFKSRSGFNKAAMLEFPKLSSGSYRVVLDAGDFVIKLRLAHRDADRGPWSKDAMEAGNAVERKNWMGLTSEFQFFVLEPTYIVLPNKHDVTIMPKVKVCDKRMGCSYDLITGFSGIMHEQYAFITGNFADAHKYNIGWNVTEQRVWLIDYNHGAGYEGWDKRLSTSAKNIIKKVSQSSERKAA